MPEFVEVDVAVGLIVRSKRVLLTFNDAWGSFTLPMTKRRKWPDERTPAEMRHEAWADAACRAVAECTGRTLLISDIVEVPVTLEPYQQSDRDGAWKRYRFRIFQHALPEEIQIRPVLAAEWLRPEDALDENRRPLSPTALFLIGQLQGQARLNGVSFP